MKFFFATNLSTDKNKLLTEAGVKKRLLSYFYLKQTSASTEFLETFSTHGYDTKKITPNTRLDLKKVSAYIPVKEVIKRKKLPKLSKEEKLLKKIKTNSLEKDAENLFNFKTELQKSCNELGVKFKITFSLEFTQDKIIILPL